MHEAHMKMIKQTKEQIWSSQIDSVSVSGQVGRPTNMVLPQQASISRKTTIIKGR